MCGVIGDAGGGGDPVAPRNRPATDHGESSGRSVRPRRDRTRIVKRLKLAGLAVLGLCTASIPVTIAVVLSATGTSDVLTLGSSAPKPSGTTPAEAVARMRCVPERGHYALTFDDGPFPETTPRLVAALEEANAVATFFDVGRRAAAHPRLVDLQRSVGQVANHSYTHPRLEQVSSARRIQELQATAKVLQYPNVFFRPPYGETGEGTDEDIARSGLTTVYWTVDTGDADGAHSDEIVERALRVQPGGIVLLHDRVAAGIDAVPRIVAGLEERGMCPGFLAPTREARTGPNGLPLNAIAVKP